jgi:hypothetical protein
MEKAAEVSLVRGPVADIWTVRGRAMGVEQLEQTVIAYHHLKRIDFSMWLDKSPFEGNYGNTREGVFAALPFSIPGFTIRHEIPGAVIEPYHQQVEGSATDHYAVRSFTDLSNEQYGVTLCPIETSLLSYGEPQVTPLGGEWPWWKFETSREYPQNSRVYIYLMNNMFGVNTRIDQRGPADFRWALRSHEGDWKTGRANEFGRQVQQPLLVWRADGKNKGAWAASESFMSVDQSNVSCSTIKPAEANGQGMILRFNETTGKETAVEASLPFLGKISSVIETNLVEVDRHPLELTGEHTFTFKIRSFGVKTVRVICDPVKPLLSPTGIKALATADMQVELAWDSREKDDQISHYNIYRDKSPECEVNQLNFLGQSTSASFTDRPQLNHMGWIRMVPEPNTEYYYRIVAVDRLNNVSEASEAFKVKTLRTDEKNLLPLRVEGVSTVLVSPLTPHHFVNVLFRTACEPDITAYEVHRSTSSGFTPGTETLQGMVKSDDIIKGSNDYGHTEIDYPVKDFDHTMYRDKSIKPKTTYHYKVCAVDAAGQKGEFSTEAVIETGE